MVSSKLYPEYRVRLFLSVDLVGSTKYKNTTESTEWIKVFKDFYSGFPAKLKNNYSSEIARSQNEYRKENCDSNFPKIWKTVGDEILFCCRIVSLRHLGLCIDSFIKTLGEYAENPLKGFGLDTKGNAWAASFPTPNIALRIKNDGDSEGDLLLNEETEQAIDADPSSYDFLGKDMDAGFRIAQNSSADELTLSPALALLLCGAKGNSDKMGYNKNIRFNPMQKFKGVADDSPYPVLAIDTCRDNDKRELSRYEREFLGEKDTADNEKLGTYLKKYLEHHNIECPIVKLSITSGHLEPPEYYHKARKEWEKNSIATEDEDNSLKEPSKEEPLSDEQNKRLNDKLLEAKSFDSD